MALASITRCFCPSLILMNCRSRKSCVPVIVIVSSTIRLSSSDNIPSIPVYGYRPILITSRQVISSGLTADVITMDICLATLTPSILPMSLPSRKITPPLFLSCPVTVLSRVDLPQPFGPIRVTILPGTASIQILPTISLSYPIVRLSVLRFIFTLRIYYKM